MSDSRGISGEVEEAPPLSFSPPVSSATPCNPNHDDRGRDVPTLQRIPPAKKEVESHFWLTHADQTILALLSLVLLALLAMYWVRLSNWGTAPVEIEHLASRPIAFHLDANSATWVEWSQLEGIGDGLARRIVADREQNGPFRSVDDLRRVKGIGPKTLEKLRPWLMVESESNVSPDVAQRSSQRQK